MRPVLLDTNAYVAFKRGESDIIEIVQRAEMLGVSSVVLGELLSGFECGNKTKKNKEELHAFLSASRIKLFHITSDTATFYSHIYFVLKRKGVPIPSNDLWIAAQVLENGGVLCTYDKHFDAIDGLITGTTAAELIM